MDVKFAKEEEGFTVLQAIRIYLVVNGYNAPCAREQDTLSVAVVEDGDSQLCKYLILC